MRNKVPPFIVRVSFLLAVTGGFMGVLIGWTKGDELGWSLLRGALLFLAFGCISCWWLDSLAKVGWEAARNRSRKHNNAETGPLSGLPINQKRS